MNKNTNSEIVNFNSNYDYSKIKRVPWLQKVVDQNGPVITREDRIKNTQKYQDWKEMEWCDFKKKYSKNLS